MKETLGWMLFDKIKPDDCICKYATHDIIAIDEACPVHGKYINIYRNNTGMCTIVNLSTMEVEL